MLDLLQKCEEEVRAGRGHQVAQHLARLNGSQIPRELLLRFANVARRASLHTLGLRLLSPAIYQERNKWHVEATAAELAEYSVLLQRIGAVGEALRILERVDMRLVPDARLYKAFCHFAQWDYDLAIPELEAFLESDLSPYWRIVGRVNLAAALVSTERFEAARNLLDQNIELAKQGEFNRLMGNCLELRAQTYIHQMNFNSAQRDLGEAELLLGTERTFDELFVRKWKAILHALTTGNPESIYLFKAEALRRQHWESVRECDLYALKLNFEQERFHHLVAGTPFPAYRARIFRQLKQNIDVQSYIYGAPDSPCLDLASGFISDGRELNRGKSIHRLLSVLLRDLYRPMRVAAIFAELFSGEHFDIHSSTGRVHQILRRTRRYLEKTRIPVEIRQLGRNYRIEITGNFSVRLPFQSTKIDGNRLVLARLVEWAQLQNRRVFTAREARGALGLSLTGFNCFSNWALTTGYLQRLNAGPQTRYLLIWDTKGCQIAA